MVALIRAGEKDQQLEQAARKPIGEAKDLKQQGSNTHAPTLRPTTPRLRFGGEARTQAPPPSNDKPPYAGLDQLEAAYIARNEFMGPTVRSRCPI